MLKYWAEEPPAHVLLALRYLGPGKRGKKMDEAETRVRLGEFAKTLAEAGRPAAQGAMPEHLRKMIEAAERMKKEHRGLTPNP